MKSFRKIFFFIYSLSSGGAERVTISLANYWADKGVDVSIITLKNKKSDYYQLNNRINRISLNLDQESKSIINSILNNLKRIIILRNIIKIHQPDIVISMMDTANIYLSLSALGLPIFKIGSERIYPPLHKIGIIWRFLRKLLYRYLDGIVVQTETTAEWIKNLPGIPIIKVIPNPVNYPLSQFELTVSPDIEINNEKLIHTLLTVGRLNHQKGFDRLIFAFSELSPHFSNWRLVILGEGPFRKELEELRSSLKLEKKVLLPGVIDNISDWYKSSDIYVLSSRYEGFPNSLLEAMSHGLPVVSVDCETGPREIIRNKIDGLLVPQDDHEALVSALKLLMNNKSIRMKLGLKAIDVRKRYSIDSIVDMWEDLFNEIQM